MRGAKKTRRRIRLRGGLYLLPSIFTIGNILLGFYAVVRGLRGDFQNAALMIFIAGVADGLDGRIARLTHTESEFGKEFDSLADVLTFGMTPALLSYLWGLRDFGRIGWLVPLFFLVCTATRLARFNVQTKIIDSRYFAGLPSPAGAGAIAAFLFVAPDADWRPWFQAAMIFGLVAVGALMVSTFRYPSFKSVDLRKRWSYRLVLPVAAVLLVLAWRPTAFFLAAAVIYTLVGPVSWLVARIQRHGADEEAGVEAPDAAEARVEAS